MSRVLLSAVLVVAVSATLAGCTPPAPAPTASPSPTASSATPTPTPTEEPAAFVAPTTCAELIGDELAATFASRNIVLFDSANGEGIYAGGDRVIAQEGGDPFWCIYGQDMVDLSSFELVVQPVSSQSEHEGIVAVLGSQGFDQSLNGNAVTFSTAGTDTDPLPAIIHILKPDRWLTAYSGFGGDISLTRISEYLAAVDAHLATSG